MTMVRLATAEPVLPLDEAFARLDEIARGLGRPSPPTTAAAPGVTRSGPPPKPDPRAAPPPPPPSAAAPKTAPAANVDAAPAKATGNGEGAAASAPSWDDFLAFVNERKKIGLYMSLTHARFLEKAGDRLVLGVAKEKFRAELASRTSLTLLEQLAAEFFGAPCRVRIEAVSDEATPAAIESPAAETLDDPSVRAAVQIFGGAVREVRNRR